MIAADGGIAVPAATAAGPDVSMGRAQAVPVAAALADPARKGRAASAHGLAAEIAARVRAATAGAVRAVTIAVEDFVAGIAGRNVRRSSCPTWT